MNPNRPESGFVLVEAIVAFLILSIALAIGVESVAQGTGTVRRAGEVADASLVARELFATRGAVLVGEGTWTGAHPNGSAWQMTARILPDGRTPPLYLVTVRVTPPAGYVTSTGTKASVTKRPPGWSAAAAARKHWPWEVAEARLNSVL